MLSLRLKPDDYPGFIVYVDVQHLLKSRFLNDLALSSHHELIAPILNFCEKISNHYDSNQMQVWLGKFSTVAELYALLMLIRDTNVITPHRIANAFKLITYRSSNRSNSRVMFHHFMNTIRSWHSKPDQILYFAEALSTVEGRMPDGSASIKLPIGYLLSFYTKGKFSKQS